MIIKLLWLVWISKMTCLRNRLRLTPIFKGCFKPFCPDLHPLLWNLLLETSFLLVFMLSLFLFYIFPFVSFSFLIKWGFFCVYTFYLSFCLPFWLMTKGENSGYDFDIRISLMNFKHVILILLYFLTLITNLWTLNKFTIMVNFLNKVNCVIQKLKPLRSSRTS